MGRREKRKEEDGEVDVGGRETGKKERQTNIDEGGTSKVLRFTAHP